MSQTHEFHICEASCLPLHVIEIPKFLLPHLQNLNCFCATALSNEVFARAIAAFRALHPTLPDSETINLITDIESRLKPNYSIFHDHAMKRQIHQPGCFPVRVRAVSGPPGTAKTAKAVRRAQEALGKGWSVIWFDTEGSLVSDGNMFSGDIAIFRTRDITELLATAKFLKDTNISADLIVIDSVGFAFRSVPKVLKEKAISRFYEDVLAIARKELLLINQTTYTQSRQKALIFRLDTYNTSVEAFKGERENGDGEVTVEEQSEGGEGGKYVDEIRNVASVTGMVQIPCHDEIWNLVLGPYAIRETLTS